MLKEIDKLLFYQKLTQLPFVERIMLYGSRARGTHRDRSDIDLAVDCPRATLQNWVKVMEIVDDQMETLLKIDCVRYDKLPTQHPLRTMINQEGIVLYEKDKK